MSERLNTAAVRCWPLLRKMATFEMSASCVSGHGERDRLHQRRISGDGINSRRTTAPSTVTFWLADSSPSR